MAKGITPVIATILLLLITVSMTGISFVFFQRTAQTAAQSGEEQLQQQAVVGGTSFRIESTGPGKIYIRNLGSRVIHNASLAVFIDNKNIRFSAQNISVGNIGEITLSIHPSGTRNIKVTGIATKDSLDADFGQCQSGWYEYDSHCYFMAPAATWQNVEASCVSNNAHLVTINNAAENSFVNGLTGVNSAWIGLNDIALEGSYVWSGEQSSYLNWNSGEPNNWGGIEDCDHIIGGSGAWNDLSCASALIGICE